MTNLLLIGGVAYSLIGMFVMGVAAVEEAQSRRSDPILVIVLGAVWPLFVALLAGTGFCAWSGVFDDD
ncbi:hypothetical protein EXE44_04865 [Halorubrum sp. SS7]|nr:MULTISPECIES: hypothetical protein [unclassified Halorubrum]TKX52391.1 hypothetical protein EXE42_16380 [Halorubrum sp. SP3]TKX58878.1 hypothetical protein EXE44_04865 [Halorubrum sp. SS7]TKX64056.1 hypothetical protein EXE45_16690 [Halorubrum sp. SP9]